MKDYEYLVHLIYCAIHDTAPSEKPTEVSFEGVYELGKEHEVGNIAFLSVDRLKNKPAEELYKKWQMFYFFSVQRDVRQQAAYETITRALHESGIRTLEAQGTVTKTLYPSPELRMMSDIDFIIDLENLEKARAVMTDLGCETWQHGEGEFDAVYDDIVIEFHTEFFGEKIYNRRENYRSAINQPFSHSVPDSDDPLKYVLDDAYFYLYSVLHIIKHYEITGCGIRRVLDLYYLKKAYGDVTGSELIGTTIEKYGFKDSCDALFALEGEWFENIKSERDLSDAVDIILLSGNHGTREAFTKNVIKKEETDGVRHTRLRRIIAFIFPPKEYIYINYPELIDRNYSTLRCQLYRLFVKLKNARLKSALNYIRTIISK